MFLIVYKERMKKIKRAAYLIIGGLLLLALAGSVFFKFFGESFFRSQVLARLPFDVQVADLNYIFPSIFEFSDVEAGGQIRIQKAWFIMEKADIGRFIKDWFSGEDRLPVLGELTLQGMTSMIQTTSTEIPIGQWSQAELQIDVALIFDKSLRQFERLSYEGQLEIEQSPANL